MRREEATPMRDRSTTRDVNITLGNRVPGGSIVRLHLGRLIESRLLIQANSGGGKSWALRRILEQSHGHVQQLVLDIEGEFHTLRERYDYVLAARSGGDTLAAPHTAALLARRLLELGVSAVLDLYELPAHERVRFVRVFLEAVVDAPKALWHPVLVVVDEAHHFCPEDGDAESASAVIDLMTRGRKRGFCGVLATQRLSKLAKDAAAEANVKLIGRAALDNDMKRAAAELGMTSIDDRAKLRALPAGQFYAFGPGLSDQVVEILVGAVQTTHPRPGQRAAPVPPAREKVRKVLAQLQDLPKEAEQEAKTAAELRAQIASLKHQLAAHPTPPAPLPSKPVEIPILKDVQVKRLEAVVERFHREAQRLEDAAIVARDAGAEARNHGNEIKASVAAARDTQRGAAGRTLAADGRSRAAAPQLDPEPTAVTMRYARAAVLEDAVLTPNGAGDLGKGERAILTAIAQHERGVTREQVSVLTAYKKSSRDVYLRRLQALGYSNQHGETITATSAGVGAQGAGFVPLPTGAALREHWQRTLPDGEARIFAVVVEAWPGWVEREAIAVGLKKSSRDVYLRRLAARELIAAERGGVKAADHLVS